MGLIEPLLFLKGQGLNPIPEEQSTHRMLSPLNTGYWRDHATNPSHIPSYSFHFSPAGR